jgi:hypothetical protein
MTLEQDKHPNATTTASPLVCTGLSIQPNVSMTTWCSRWLRVHQVCFSFTHWQHYYYIIYLQDCTYGHLNVTTTWVSRRVSVMSSLPMVHFYHIANIHSFLFSNHPDTSQPSQVTSTCRHDEDHTLTSTGRGSYRRKLVYLMDLPPN